MSSPVPFAMAVMAHSAESDGAGRPHATDVTASVVGKSDACTHVCVGWLTSLDQTAGDPVADPMARQVVVAQEMAVTADAPEGKVSGVQAPFTGVVITVASVKLVWSPIAVATQSAADGQVMAPTEVTIGGIVSELTPGDNVAGSLTSCSTPGVEVVDV